MSDLLLFELKLDSFLFELNLVCSINLIESGAYE